MKSKNEGKEHPEQLVRPLTSASMADTILQQSFP